MPYSLRPSTRPSPRPPTRPASPSRPSYSHAHSPAPEDTFSSALHAALNSAASTSTAPPPEEMYPREKPDRPHSTLEIVVAQETLVLKGSGSDVEPAVLSGNVVLHLAERTSIKEINLQFRGKARVPQQSHES